MSHRKAESKRMKLDRMVTPSNALRHTDSGILLATGLLKQTQSALPPPEAAAIDSTIDSARDWLIERQNPEGWWCAELEADTTLESYFILFKTLFGHRDDPKIPKLAKVIRDCILPEGAWNIFEGGPPEISISCLSYFAMKLAGVPASDPDMIKSRDAILKMGGVVKANTYTKYYLAFFDQYDWDHVPAIPPEMILLPKSSPIHIYDMSSWSRTIFVPLGIIYALKPVCIVPPECQIDELFVGGREHADLRLQRDDKPVTWKNFFLLTDKALKIAQKFPIDPVRNFAIKKAEEWMLERFPMSGGLSAILPAMMNSVIALKCLGYAEDHPLVVEGIRELDALEIYDEKTDTIRVQPCVSPVWDTCISVYAMGQTGIDPNHPAMKKGASWLLKKQTTLPGDWQHANSAPPGGWYFEFLNEFYPDVDDTCMTLMALHHVNAPEGKDVQQKAMDRGLVWMLGMQNDDGGWASFDKGNDKEFLTKVPFADHNAMIDPSTSDITSRVIESLSFFKDKGFTLNHPVIQRGIEFIKKDQCQDGSWFGRWGVNYIYGTWQVLRGMKLIGEDMNKGWLRRGVEWFLHHQNTDGGWGESIESYETPSLKGIGASTPSQTAWALMGLISANQTNSQAVRRGIKYLLDTQTSDGTWDETLWTGTGFPKVFYLKYHYYRHYFPMMALAQYRTAKSRD
ncbi:MAG: squalene--hopene cyclase [Planctomycetota bacterium]